MDDVTQIILGEVRTLSSKIDNISNDVAVLKANHDTGNRSEQIAAIAAIIAVIISIISLLGACKYVQKSVQNNKHNSSDAVGESSPLMRGLEGED